MVIAILTILGLAWGSFVNALVWRLHEQEAARGHRPGGKTVGKSKSRTQPKDSDLSILNGRSMCPNCHHTLSAGDLIPLVSWLALKGKCRYCKKPISAQYPLVEALTALVFVLSYVFWPVALLSASSLAIFGLWLAILVFLAALAVYDSRWQILPDKLVLGLATISVAQAIVSVASAGSPLDSLIEHLAGIIIGGGLFYLIFVISSGKWIGGGDVKLGFVLGLLAGSWKAGLLMLFLAALIGTLVSLPLIASKKLSRKSAIPFGPFLILSTIVVVIWGSRIIDWYVNLVTLG